MKKLIALDGGGTKLDAVLFDESGHILKHCVARGGNATDIGKEEALRRFDACMGTLLDGVSGPIDALYGGMAGVLPNGDFYSEHASETIECASVRFDDDGCNLISGGVGQADGCGMVCGTGSSLFVRISGQPLRHIGGKGYLIDTGGSGFDLGQQAIRMALRSVDGRIGPTVLTELLAGILGMPVSDAVIPAVHAGGRPYIASFARAVFEGRARGDAVCQSIFENGAEQMADLTRAAERYFSGTFPVIAGGGIIGSYPEYAEEIQKRGSPRAVLRVLDAPPVYGAAVEAMADAGFPEDERFKARFLADYTAAAR